MVCKIPCIIHVFCFGYNSYLFYLQRLMFWADWGANAKIERADLTGENRQILVNLYSQRIPISVVIDFEAQRIYWMGASYLYNVDLDGYYRRYVRYIRENINPVDLALYGDNLYWVDKNSRSIHWFNKTQPVDMFSFGHLTNGILVGAVVSDETRQPVGKLASCVIVLGICYRLFGVWLFDPGRFFAPCLYARVAHRTHFTQFYLMWALVGNALDECLIKEMFIISR